MTVKYPTWINKIEGAAQTPEEMNGIVEVLQNHAENLSLHDVRILAAASGIYTAALTPTSEVPAEVGDKVFLVTEPGTYTNFGNVVLPQNSFGFIFKSNDLFTIEIVKMPNYDDSSIRNLIKEIKETDLPNKVDKVEGKGLSTNDFTDGHKNKVDKISTFGDGSKFLNDIGNYETIKAPIQSLSVDGVNVVPDSEGNVEISIPDAPVQGVTVNGVESVPNAQGIVNVEVPDAPIQSIYTNGVENVPDSAGAVHIQIVQDVDQTIDPMSTNAVSGGAVAAEFSRLGSKYGSALSLNTVGEGEEEKHSISLLDEEGNVISTTDEFSAGGGGDGGGTSTTRIVLTKLTENLTIKEGDEAKLKYYFDHQDRVSGESTGLGGRATVTIISGATSTVTSQDINPDSTYQIDVTGNLLVGTNTVRVRVEVDNGESTQVATISFRIQVVTLKLSSSFDFAQVFNKGQQITLPFGLSGSGNKTLRLYVNGVERDVKSITTSSSNGSFVIPTNTLNHGSNSLQIISELEISTDKILKSNSIYFDVAIAVSGNTTPIIATRFDYQDGRIINSGSRPVLVARQFEDAVIRFAGYNPSQNQNTIRVNVNNQQISEVLTSFVQRITTYRSTLTGSFPATIVMPGGSYTFNVDVSNSGLNITEPTDNIVFKLSATGRSNSDSNRNTWTDRGITTSFNNVQFEGDGWIGNALRLMNGGQAVINYKPLSTANQATQINAFTFQAKIRVSSVSNSEAPLIQCMTGNVGFVITAEEAKMTTGGNSSVAMKFAAGQEYNITFVSMPVATALSSDYEVANSGMVFLYINGILSGAVQRGTGDNIYQSGTPANITLGGDGAIIEVFNTRVYKGYLLHDQVLDVYMSDLSNVNDVISIYNNNNITDAEGDVTVDSLPDGTRYMIITGAQANGMSTVKYAAAINNKNTRYDVDEMLHIIKGEDKELNWKCVGGCIRLQGTSSLAYPIKNYRIYFRSAASSSVFGKVYTGVDAQGNGGALMTASKPKLSFKKANSFGKIPAPVNVWCLKADFAESSSSHNTGMARMTNDALVASGSPTPAQKNVDSSYAYDVRTTVDGEPCYLFHRNTTSDKALFIGKFNMNNDKSTEEVFGFTNIDGYHNAPWVNEKFAGQNPTECWEFLNNDFPMGSYLVDDFDAVDENGVKEWTKVFEARFPDAQDEFVAGTRPFTYLPRWVKWVKSTQNNKAKFKAELKDYADVSHLCKYFVFTQLMGAVDQMVKNAMLGFWYNPDVDKMLAYYIFYDNDTILGVRNDGRLKYNWDIDRQTLDAELTAGAGVNIYAYMGHNSVLWNNLESEFSAEITQAYRELRTVLTNDKLFNYFDKDQAGKFPEKIYNLDAQYKYIEPRTLGIDVINNGAVVNTKYSYLESMQGSRASHRRWWLENRLDLFDARHGAGQYSLTDITWKGISDAGASVSLIMKRDYYAEFRRESTVMGKDFVRSGVLKTYTYNESANVGTIFHLLGGKYFRRLNLSTWGGFTDLGLPTLESLEELILGMNSKTYTLSELVISTKLPMLKVLDITNYTMLPSLDVSACYRLETLIARGCTALGTITFASGSPLKSVVLPQNLNTLKLEGLPLLANSGITFPNGNRVKNLIVNSCPNINWETLFNTLGGVINIRVTGIKRSGNKSWLDRFVNLGGIDANGNVVDGARLVGAFQLTTSITETELANYKVKFPELEIKQPDFTVLEFDDNVSDPANISNLDNYTGYKFNTPYQPSGHISKILNSRFGCLGKQTVKGKMSILKLSDSNFNYLADGVTPADITGGNGDVYIYDGGCWQKGVNDKKNEKKYHLYSTNETKPNPVEPNAITKVLSLNDMYLTTQNSTFYRSNFAVVNKTTLSESLVSNNQYNTFGVKVTGFRQVRFPTVPGIILTQGIVSILFCDDNGNVVSTVSISSFNSNFSPGMYYVADVPSNATWAYWSLGVYDEFDKVVLTTSSSIYDIEDEWVKINPFLTGVFEGSLDSNSRIRSVNNSSISLGNISWTDANYYAGVGGRQLQQVDYTMHNYIANLFFAKYGHRNSQRQCGYGSNSNSRTIGTTSMLGMIDTVNLDNETQYAWYTTRNIDGTVSYTRLDNSKCLGFENWFGNKSEWVDGISLPNSANKVGRFTIYDPSKNTDRFMKGATNNAYISSVINGLYMDTIKSGNNSTGTSESHYADWFELSTYQARVVFRSSFNANVHGGVSYMYASYDSSYADAYRGCRLAFRGEIEEAPSSSAFGSMNMIA